MRRVAMFGLPLALLAVMATLLLSISAQVSAAPRIPCRPGQSCASWGIMTTANPGTLQNLLLATAAVSANDLWAGGWKMDTAAIASRTASRATTRRALRPAAPPARHLRPGAVRGPKDGCGCDSYALIEHWTGSTWSVATQPDSSVPGTEILGMTAISSTDVWAVGDHYDATSGNNEGLIEHWNGTVWSAVSAGPVLQGEELIGVAGKAANDVWAVGGGGARGGGAPFIEHWNGSNWSVVAVTPAFSTGGILLGVVARSLANTWAVGFVQDPTSGTDVPLIERYNSVAWAQQTAPSLTPAGIQDLVAVAASPDGTVVAVGYYPDPSTGNARTLAIRLGLRLR